MEIIRPFISCSKWDQLRCIRYWTSEKITLIFDGPSWCWNRLTIDSEWGKMLQASCKVTHNSCSCSSNVLSWIFLDICFMTACSLWRDFHRRNTNLKHSYSSSTWYSALLLLSIKRKEILGQTEMEMRHHFSFLQNFCILCHCVRAPLLGRKGGVWSVFPHWDECVWVEGKTLADVSVGLSSSSLPVGQKDRDGSLSAGLWLDPSP